MVLAGNVAFENMGFQTYGFKANILYSGLIVSEVVRVTLEAAASHRNTDMRGG